MGSGEQIPGHEMFGLDDQPPRHAEAAANPNYAPGPGAAPAPWPPPQYVYVQGPLPSKVPPTVAQNRTGIYLL